MPPRGQRLQRGGLPCGVKKKGMVAPHTYIHTQTLGDGGTVCLGKVSCIGGFGCGAAERGAARLRAPALAAPLAALCAALASQAALMPAASLSACWRGTGDGGARPTTGSTWVWALRRPCRPPLGAMETTRAAAALSGLVSTVWSVADGSSAGEEASRVGAAVDGSTGWMGCSAVTGPLVASALVLPVRSLCHAGTMTFH